MAVLNTLEPYGELKENVLMPGAFPLHSGEKKKVKMLVTQSCLTLCNPMDCSPLDSSVHGILQARYRSGLPFSSLGDRPDPGIKLGSLALQVDSLTSEPPGKQPPLSTPHHPQ